MPIGHLTYLDIDLKTRQETAQVARQRFYTFLENPFLTEDQKAYLHAQLERIDQWEKGLL